MHTQHYCIKSMKMSEDGYKHTSDENKVNGESIKIANGTSVETCTTEGKKRSFDETEASPASNSSTEEATTTTKATEIEHKRTRSEETNTVTEGMTDICTITNLNEGDRIEVHWDVESTETGVSILIHILLCYHLSCIAYLFNIF